ncbi:MAG: 30S ribosomal protein S2 [Alphaproteobacteria bacterium]
MALPEFTMRQLLEAGVHFGHQTRRWNPKMGPYIFGIRGGAHIIDLQQTAPLLHRALKLVRDTVAGGSRVLFVGTKRQATDLIAESAKSCGQYYVNHRWLGGMLTNWKTVSVSIRRLRELDEQLEQENTGQESTGLTKKELLQMTRERNKLDRALGGIKDMGGLPDVIFIIDTNKEKIAIAEARKLNIPVVAVIDSNSDPDLVDYPIPGNDDAIRAINLYCQLMRDAVLDGIQQELEISGGDIGEAEDTPVEVLPEEAEPEAKKAAEESTDAPAEEASKAEDAPAEEAAKAEEAPAEEAPVAEETPAEQAAKAEDAPKEDEAPAESSASTE